jgi:hypothetical protein
VESQIIWRIGNKKNNRKILKGFQYIDWSIFLGPPFLKGIFIGIYFGISRITSLTVAFGIKLSGHSSLGKRSLSISEAVVDSSGIEGAI